MTKCFRFLLKGQTRVVYMADRGINFIICLRKTFLCIFLTKLCMKKLLCRLLWVVPSSQCFYGVYVNINNRYLEFERKWFWKCLKTAENLQISLKCSLLRDALKLWYLWLFWFFKIFEYFASVQITSGYTNHISQVCPWTRWIDFFLASLFEWRQKQWFK